uniref:Cerebellin 11 n=1 Tax=Sinocyclocheilus rhinocerous TaxID=307959 RepID=A0A673KPZ3_9TELE
LPCHVYPVVQLCLCLCELWESKEMTFDIKKGLVNTYLIETSQLLSQDNCCITFTSFTPISQSPKVAFTASMSNTEDTHRGPFSTETKLIFDKVLTNIGNAYDPVTGVFTAPVKGVYYFRYSGSAFSSHDMGLSIFKGTARFVSSYEYNSGERNDQMSNGAVMELDVGEEVHMRLWIRTWIFVDPRYNYSTFTGYLLYPLDSTSV